MCSTCHDMQCCYAAIPAILNYDGLIVSAKYYAVTLSAMLTVLYCFYNCTVLSFSLETTMTATITEVNCTQNATF